LRQITKNEVLPVLLVGNAIGMIQVLEDPVTGSQGTYFVSTDAAGLEYPPVRLGKDFSEAADSIDVITFDALETNVKAKLADGFRHRAERAALYENVKSVVAGVIAAKTNPLDPVRQAYIAADRSVESMLELTT
jgi:hypothetical protein